MSSKNFTVKNGISVGSNEVISANGDMIVHGNLMIGDHMLVSSTGDLTVPGNLIIGSTTIQSNVNDHANSAYIQANTATSNAGSSSSYANSAYLQANTADQRAVTSGVYANSAYLQANTATTNAATADQRAVTSGVYANSAYLQANTATTNAATADQKAVTSGVYANSAFATANTASINATSAGSYANSAFTKSNTATTNAATADQRAVTSGVYANAAFITANTKYNSTGGTISGDVNITGNLNITGNTVTHASDSLVINDPLILLANNNPGNILDTGFIAHYIEGGTTKHTGLVRDSSANTYYLFDGYTPHIQETNILDSNDASLRITTLRSNLISDSVLVRGYDVVNHTNTAFSQANTATTNAATADQKAVSAGSYANSAFATANSKTSNVGTVTSVGGTGSYGGLTLTGTVTTSGNLTLGGTPTGTWPIGVSGNAATVTNGVYTTGNQTIGGIKTFSSNLTITPGTVTLGTSTINGVADANWGILYKPSKAGAVAAHGFLNASGGSAAYITNAGNIVASGSISATALAGSAATGSGASGTWGINVTGNAATATTATNQSGGTVNATTGTFSNQLLINYNIASPANYYNALQQEIRATSGTAGIGLHRNGFSHCGIYHDATNTLKFNMNSGTVTLNASIGTVIGSGNYNSYSPTLTGGGASGTWGISVTGNAATATTAANYLPLAGGTMTGTITNSAASLVIGTFGGLQRGYLYNDTGGFGLLTSGGGWALRVNYGTNTVVAEGVLIGSADVRAPIFYDTQDTSFYLDPNNTSVLNAIHTWGEIGARRNDVQSILRSYNISAGSPLQFYLDHTGGNVNIGNNRGVVFGRGSYWEFDNSARAPIFYDSNNTGYYVDPASSSSLNQINGRPTTNLMFYEGFTLNADTMQTNATGFTYAVNAPYVGPIMRFGAGAYDTQFNTTYGGVRLAYRNRNGDIGAWYPWQVVTTYGGNPGGDLYANVFYDSDNSGFYANPAGTSNFNVLELNTNTGSGNWPQRITHPDRGIYFINTSGSAIPLYFSVNSGSTVSGYILTSGATTQYITSSDYRMKENVQDLDRNEALNKILSIKPKTFNWLEVHGGKADVGFIAHELQEVAPECVSGEKDGLMPDGRIMPQGVDTTFLMPTICAAIQKQQEIIDQLMAKVAVLEGN